MTTEAVQAIFGQNDQKLPEQPPVATPVPDAPKPADTHDVLRELQNQEQQSATAPSKEKTEEFFQTRYQGLSEAAKRKLANYPGLYDSLMAEAKGEKKVETQKTQPPLPREDYSNEMTLSPKQLQAMIEDAVAQSTTKVLQKQREQDFFALEKASADEAMAEFERLGATPEEIAAAYRAVYNDYGFTLTKPNEVSRAMIAIDKELRLRKGIEHSANRVTTASNEATAKFEAAKLVAQPAPSSPSGPQEKSFESTVIEMMKSAGNPQAKQAIFNG